MGIAALILGIIAIVIGWIPFVCFIAFMFAIIGLILGIVDTIHKSKIGDNKKAISIAGLIVSAVAIPIIIFSTFISLGIFAAVIEDDVDSYRYDDYYYDDDDYFDRYLNNRNWNRYTNTIDYRNL